MLTDPAKILQEINELKRRGATLTELWEYILKSRHRQKVWIEHSTNGGQLAIKMWRFLLASKERRTYIQEWEQKHQEEDTTKVHWWEVILSFPEKIRSDTFEKLSMMMGTEAKESTPAIIHFLSTTEGVLRQEAAEAMGRLGALSKEVIPSLVKALQDKNGVVREEAFWALGKMGPDAKEAVPALIQAFQAYKDWDTRIRIIDTWGKIGVEAQEAAPLLNQHLNHPNEYIRHFIHKTLKKIQKM